MKTNGYADIYEALKNEVHSEVLPRGEAISSERELMNRFGVSRTTVRRAIDRLEKQGLLVRRPGIGTFVAGGPAPDLGVRTLNLGVEPGHIQDVFYAPRIIEALRSACSEHNCNLLVRSREELVDSDDLDGIILAQATRSDYQKISQRRLPAVLLNRIVDLPGISYLAVDYRQMVFQVTDQLIRQGARRIALIGGSDDPNQYSTYFRKLGWRQAFQAHNLPCPEELSFEVRRGMANLDECYTLFAEQKIEVVLLTFGMLCPAVFSAVERAKLRVPNDVELICFDDLSEHLFMLPGPISYISMPLREMSRLAVDYLAGWVRNGENTELRRLFTAEFIPVHSRYCADA